VNRRTEVRNLLIKTVRETVKAGAVITLIKKFIFAFERGKPDGEGEEQYIAAAMPPHRSTLIVKVARTWAGLVRCVPHRAL
jgi:hypothetical protein